MIENSFKKNYSVRSMTLKGRSENLKNSMKEKNKDCNKRFKI